MIVMKFGGSSVGDSGRIKAMAEIVRGNLARNPVVVVSAFGGVTDSLIDLARKAKGGKPNGELDDVRNRHLKTMKELGLEGNLIAGELEELERLMDGIALLSELTPKTLDKVMSFGERMSSKIIASYMEANGVKAAARNAYDIGMLTDSNFGDADVLPETADMIRGAFKPEQGVVSVVTGYIGKDRQGEITTLGRSGSDYTASIVGAAIGAEEIQIWTDVDGVMTSDPRIVKGAMSIESVSYSEASELAFMGAKVLHPKTILPAIEKGIPVRVLNTFNPSHRGTTIVRDIKTRSRLASIACKRRVCVINISTPEMFLAHGFLRRVFEIFDNLGFSVDMVSTSEVNVSVTIDGKHDLQRLVRELEKISKVEVRENRAKISLVGNEVSFMPDLFKKLFEALSEIKVEMMSSSTSEVNQSFVVKEEQADEAVRRLHMAFFGS